MIYVMLLIINALTIVGLFYSVKKCLSLLEKMDEISAQVEESLDIIDESYKNVSKHLNSPVLFDDPVVITMINDVKSARSAMLLIANKVTEPFSYESVQDEEKMP